MRSGATSTDSATSPYSDDGSSADGAISVDLPDGPTASPLLPLSPTRFFASAAGAELEFHRNARGVVHAVSVVAGNSRAYYRRQVAHPVGAGAEPDRDRPRP